MVSHTIVFCCMLGVCFREAQLCIRVISTGVRGGGWYVMCAKSVAVAWLCAHCFDKNSVLDERAISHYLLQLTKCKRFVRSS